MAINTPASSPSAVPPVLPDRDVLRANVAGDLKNLSAEVWNADAVLKEFSKNVDVNIGVDTILHDYQEEVPGPYRDSYNARMEGLRTILIARSLQLVKDSSGNLQPGNPESSAVVWQAIQNVIHDNLNRISGGDGKISVADFERAGVLGDPLAELWQGVKDKDCNVPADKEATKQKTAECLKQSILEAAVTFSHEDTSPALADRDPMTARREGFQHRVATVAMQLLGGDPPLLEAKELEKILDDLKKDPKIAGSPAAKAALEMMRGDAEDPHTLDKMLSTETTAEGVEIPYAYTALLAARNEYNNWNQNGDASGTTIGKKGTLFGIFSYYIGTTATGLGFIGDALIHHRIGWENAALTALQLAAIAPEKVDNFLAGRDLNKPAPLLDSEKLGERFEQLSANGKHWLLALDPAYFGKTDANGQQRSGSDALRKFIREARDVGYIETTDLVRFLKGDPTMEELADKKLASKARNLRDPQALRDIHDVKDITDPKEKRLLFSLIQSCLHNDKTPTQLYGSVG